MNDLVGEIVGELGACAARPTRLTSSDPSRTMPLANITRSAETISTASSASKAPSTAVTPAGSSDLPRSTTAARAPSSTTIRPAGRRAKAIQSLRAPSARRWGRKIVPTPGLPATASASTSGRRAEAMTTWEPDHTAIFAAASFEDMPPRLVQLAAPPARSSSSRSISVTSSIKVASASCRGSALSSPAVSVSSTRTSAPQQVGDEGRKAVVVPEADLVVRDGVVLVHDRDDTELQQPGEGCSGVQVALAVGEVERGEQDLAGEQALGAEGVLVDAHEPRLADRRERLQGHRVARVPAEGGGGGDTGGDGAGGDDDDGVAVPAQPGDLGTELADGARCRPSRRRRSQSSCRSWRRRSRLSAPTRR